MVRVLGWDGGVAESWPCCVAGLYSAIFSGLKSERYQESLGIFLHTSELGNSGIEYLTLQVGGKNVLQRQGFVVCGLGDMVQIY